MADGDSLPVDPVPDPNAVTISFTPMIIEDAPVIPARAEIIPNTPKVVGISIDLVEAPLNYNLNLRIEFGYSNAQAGTYTHLPQIRRDIRVTNIFSDGAFAKHPVLKDLAPAIYSAAMLIASQVTDADGIPCHKPPANSAQLLANGI